MAGAPYGARSKAASTIQEPRLRLVVSCEAVDACASFKLYSWPVCGRGRLAPVRVDKVNRPINYSIAEGVGAA